MKFKLITGTTLTLERALNEWAAEPARTGYIHKLISTQIIATGEGFAVLICYLEAAVPKQVPPNGRQIVPVRGRLEEPS